ncbi:unnamed protein product [Allacma fusca]|uniref:Uncharacterized protein n=1 Tax=Allacma fusca TaxID=39272 RepID=A0A8J2PNM4_9HEXA|nr:unnamed protein product [Allacma fusca]
MSCCGGGCGCGCCGLCSDPCYQKLAAVFAATHATKSCAVIDVVQSATSHSFLLTIGAMKKLKWANSLATTIKGDGFANVTYGCAKFMGNVAEDAVVKTH